MKSSDSNSAPPNPLVFFLDRSLGHNVVASALRRAGYLIELHDDHFTPDAADADWIPEVGAKGWIILTKDQKIMVRAPELAAVAKGSARLYALSTGQVSGPEMAISFLKAIPKIIRSLSQQDPPYAAKIDANGRVHLVWKSKELLASLKNGQWVHPKKKRS